MTSHLEILNPKNGEWMEVKTLQPGQRSTFTNYLPGELEELYIFKCLEDNSATKVDKKVNPRQTRLSHDKTFVPLSYPDEHIADLSEGEEFRLNIITQGGNSVEAKVVHRIP